MNADRFIEELEDTVIVEAIAAAERVTSGEIRVYISCRMDFDVTNAARKCFLKLGMDRTEQRNAVLVYLAPGSRRLAIVGDSGVDAKVPDRFWQTLVEDVIKHLHEESATAALVHAVREISSALAEHFPQKPGDRNELPDTIERGDE